jgi:hypothetical protein
MGEMRVYIEIMSTKRLEFLDTITKISAQSFDVKTYKIKFYKLFRQECKTHFKPSAPAQTIHNLALQFHGVLFLGADRDFHKLIHIVNKLLRPDKTIEMFLSNIFYIVLTQYIKSFYNKNAGWEPISTFNEAVFELIEYANRVSTLGYIKKENAQSKTKIFDDQVINDLEHLRRADEQVTVLNTYHGIPIQNRADIFDTDHDSVILKTHTLQMKAAIRDNKSIYILGLEQLPYDISARIQVITVNNIHYLKLTNFDKLSSVIHQRNTIRVQPKKGEVVTVKTLTAKEVKTDVYDISIGGIATVLDQDLELEPNEKVTIHMPEELFGETLDVEGSFVFMSKFQEGWKYHFKMNLQLFQENRIGKYITQREQEIIIELNKHHL